MYSLLLVDDEPSVREAVRIMCDSDLYPIETIYEASNGLIGLEMMKQHNPEIVFCDIKMPEMDGISFLRSAIIDYPDTKFVILTAFDDFTYMREAIRLNVMDYLLKPVNKTALDEILNRIVLELEATPTVSDEHNAIYLEKYINDSIHRQLAPELFVSSRGKPLFSLPAWYQMCLIKILNLNEIKTQEKLDNLQSAQLLAVQWLRKCFTAKDDEAYCFIPNSQSLNEVILLVTSTETFQSSIYDLLLQCVEKLSREHHVKLFAGLGPLERFLPRNIFYAYEYLRTNISYCNTHDISSRVFPYSYVYDKPETDQERLLSAISSLNVQYQKSFDKIEETIRQLENKLANSDYYSIDLQRKLIDELVMISNAMLSDARKMGIIKKFYPINSGAAIFCDYDCAAFADLALEMLHYVWDTIHKDIQNRSTENTISYKIRVYIDNHYHENIGLETFSEMFFVCKEHLAKGFKKSYGVSIYQYLIQTRMKNAVRLLVGTPYTIDSIAQMVGYSDADSFCKSFKKHFNMLPSQYRKSETKQTL